MTLPKKFVYFPEKNKSKVSDPTVTKEKPKPKPKKDDNFASLVGFVDFKIEEYVEKLQEEENV